MAAMLSFTVQAAPVPATNPVVVMDTSMGKIEIALNQEKAPITVKNFLDYTNSGFYNDTIFHRVIKGFMIQGGGFNKDMSQKATRDPISNESTNGLSNRRGTIAMARTNVPDSATSQFFINLVDNNFLDGSNSKPGYAVFGKVISGMDVVDKISDVRTGQRGMHGDVPKESVIIKSVSVKKAKAAEKK
ncbi:peptidylprolyl isomerase [Parendozoicomonas sp. Alg238-R29]|uniref:peptidylprolyl isomerase n=1 Tax=Parendozoicomonas sp. Alg238-R29 TaxID=2993446 RepID=UPI0032B3080C